MAGLGFDVQDSSAFRGRQGAGILSTVEGVSRKKRVYEPGTQFDLGSGEPVVEPEPVDNSLQNIIAEKMGLSPIPEAKQGITTPVPQNSARDIAAAKDAAIMQAKPVPTNAGLTPDMVQRPSTSVPAAPAGQQQTAAPSAGITGSGALYFSDEQGGGKIYDAGGKATGGFGISEQIRQREEQLVAGREAEARRIEQERERSKMMDAHKLNQENATAAAIVTPKMAAEMALANDPNANPILKRNAAAEVAQFTGSRDAANTAVANSAKALGIDQEYKKIDTTTTNAGITAGAHVKAAEIAALGKEAAAIANHSQDKAKENQKDLKGRISGLVGEWSKLDLPAEYIPNLNKYASIYAESEKPDGSVFLMGANGPNRSHLALPKAYESVYNAWRQKGYNHNDAAARVAEAAGKAGHGVQVPNFNYYQTLANNRKPDNSITGL